MKIRKKQAPGSVPETLYEKLQKEAEKEQRPFSQFVGILIQKGWEVFQDERNEGVL